jgi:hypothetical protein
VIDEDDGNEAKRSEDCPAELLKACLDELEVINCSCRIKGTPVMFGR